MTHLSTPQARTPGCPIVHGRRFNPLDPVVAADPYPWLRAAHIEAPVFGMPGRYAWCVAR